MKKLLIVLFLCVSSAFAQVAPDNLFYKFETSAPPVLNVDVINNYVDREVRVETKSLKVNNPGEKNESQTEEASLIVSPKSFSLQPNARRTVRFLLKQHPVEAEEIYRVNFSPVSYSDVNKTAKSGVSIAVLVGAGTLVFALPLQLNLELSWQRSGKGFDLINTGNANLLITLEKSCSNADSCKETKIIKRLYAGNKFHTDDAQVLHLIRESFNGDQDSFVIDTETGKKNFEVY